MKNLVEKGYKKITPFFIPYAITNMGGALLAIDQARAAWGAGRWVLLGAGMALGEGAGGGRC